MQIRSNANHSFFKYVIPGPVVAAKFLSSQLQPLLPVLAAVNGKIMLAYSLLGTQPEHLF